MEDKNLHIKIDGNVAELVIREGIALPVQEPEKINLSGTIGAPAEFALKREFKPDTAHVVFSYEEMKIVLVIDEKDHYRTTVTGQTKINQELSKFGINANKTFTVKELKALLKMNRFYFADQDENMKIVANLEKFRASVQTQIEQHGSARGEKRDLVDIKVDTNLDMNFGLNIPIFIGEIKSKFNVEICFDLNDASVVVWLESPELQQLILSGREALINKNIEQFKGKIVTIQY